MPSCSSRCFRTWPSVPPLSNPGPRDRRLPRRVPRPVPALAARGPGPRCWRALRRRAGGVYRGGAGPGPAPPPSLSGAGYGGHLVRGLGDHLGLAGDAELAESGQDPGLDERAEQLFAVPHVGHAQNAVAERGDVEAHPGGHVAVPADGLAERVVLVGRHAVPRLHDDGGHDFPPGDAWWWWCGGNTGLQGQRVAEHAAAWPAAGQRADEVDGVDLDVLAVVAVAEGTAGRPVKHQVEWLTVELRPFGHDVGDQPAVVVRLEVHRPAGRVADVDTVAP